jgi:hypothetical protein
MEPAEHEAAAYTARWRPSSVSPRAAAFARDVVTQVRPEGRERAKNLLWAAGKLADYAASLGLELTPGVVLHPSTAERFTRCAPGLPGVARRTLRTNLRFIGRRSRAAPVSGRSAAAPGKVLDRYHPRLLAAAAFAGTGLICGGADPGRRNITNPLITALNRGGSLPRLDTSRLRATWLADCAEQLGLATFMHAAGDQLLPAARRPGRRAGAGRRGRGGQAARRQAAMIPLAAWEEIIDASGAAPRVEAMLPAGVRARQLSVRTLLAGMCLTQADGRPAHLTRVHRALTTLPEDEQRRLGVTADWKNGPHLLTCRQTEYTFGLVADALGKDEPDGLPSPELRAVCDQLLEASVPDKFIDASASLAVDWTGLESFSRPPPRGTSGCADPEASWGHRKNNLLRTQDELFYGYYLSARSP